MTRSNLPVSLDLRALHALESRAAAFGRPTAHEAESIICGALGLVPEPRGRSGRPALPPAIAMSLASDIGDGLVAASARVGATVARLAEIGVLAGLGDASGAELELWRTAAPTLGTRVPQRLPVRLRLSDETLATIHAWRRARGASFPSEIDRLLRTAFAVVEPPADAPEDGDGPDDRGQGTGGA